MTDFDEQFKKQFAEQFEGNSEDETPENKPKKKSEPAQSVQKKQSVPILKNAEKTDPRRKRIRKNFFFLRKKPTKQREEKTKHGFWVNALIGLANILIIIGAVVLIRTFLVSPFSVVGNSMNGNLHDGNLILVDKISYRISEPKRGDIIVFHPPIQKISNQGGFLCRIKKVGYVILQKDTSKACKMQDFFVKRVIGIPGDTVELKNRKVYVTPPGEKRKEIREDFLNTSNKTNTCFTPTCNSSRDINGVFLEVPENSVYVLGDNRTGSHDSRAWKIEGKDVPFVEYEKISGKVQAVFYPLTHISLVPTIDILKKLE